MTIEDWLVTASDALIKAGIPTPRLDAQILLSIGTKKERSWILAHSDESLDDITLLKLTQLLDRRLHHEPIAYIRGKQEFYGRDFLVGPSVLVPRPESEMIIELLLNLVKNLSEEVETLQIIDIGTGSGNLIITAALEMPKVEGLKSKVGYIGLDISEEALKVARINTKNLKANVNFKHFDLLNDSISKISNTKYQIFLANLPYVPEKYPVNEAAKHEPKIALFSGLDGLDHFRRLFIQLGTGDYGTQIVVTESLTEQHGELKEIAQEVGFKQTTEKDLVQVFSRPSTL